MRLLSVLVAELLVFQNKRFQSVHFEFRLVLGEQDLLKHSFAALDHPIIRD